MLPAGGAIVPQIGGELLYRLACSGLDATSANEITISGTLVGVDFAGANSIVGNNGVNHTAKELFTSVCVPALGMDSLILDLPITKVCSESMKPGRYIV